MYLSAYEIVDVNYLSENWRKLLRVPWTARRSSQSILKEINSEYSLEGLILKLKLQYFGHMMQIADSLETILMLEKTESKRKRGNKRWHSYTASLTKWTRIWANSGRQWRIEESGLLQSIGSQRAGHDLVTEVICKKETGCHCGKTCTKDSLCYSSKVMAKFLKLGSLHPQLQKVAVGFKWVNEF